MRRAYDGFEGRLHFFAGELGPVEAQKPLMLLDFLGSFGEANPVFRFFDEKLVDQITIACKSVHVHKLLVAWYCK